MGLGDKAGPYFLLSSGSTLFSCRGEDGVTFKAALAFAVKEPIVDPVSAAFSSTLATGRITGLEF